jgi:dGTPase
LRLMASRINSIKRMLEEKEEHLSPFASKSLLSRGRLRPETPSPVRLEFQRDRDRIIHCNSFRRLKHKTQVFIAPIGDHYVTRLTHTLEVSQIARTISRALNLNEDLTESISLGHDLGHTPFGHTGEEVLNEVFAGGFRHNEQSLRIVDFLENNGRGLNLTWEVRDGIVNHSKTRVTEILGSAWGKAGTVEGEICKIADVVAYINHDIDDAIRANIISEGQLPAAATGLLGHSRADRINAMVCDIIETSELPSILMSDPIRKATQTLLEFLYERVYIFSSAQPDAENARTVVRSLYQFFIENPECLPTEFGAYEDRVERKTVDYIASMTDQFALRKALEIGLISDPLE